MMHRVSSASSQFQGLLAPLAERGYHVVSVDLPGYGRSDPPPDADPTLSWYGDFAVELIHQLGFASGWLGGNKTGVSVALQAGVDHPNDVDGLILWSVPYFDAEMVHFLACEISPKYGPTGKGIMERWTSVYESCSPELAESIATRELGEMLLAAPNHALAHRALGRADHRALLKAAPQRTLLFNNLDDLCLAETRQAAALMSNATLVEFDYPEAYLADEHPDAVADLITGFIRAPGEPSA
jgi:pimeloyl-ACP methyl ester carboxylesterase